MYHTQQQFCFLLQRGSRKSGIWKQIRADSLSLNLVPTSLSIDAWRSLLSRSTITSARSFLTSSPAASLFSSPPLSAPRLPQLASSFSSLSRPFGALGALQSLAPAQSLKQALHMPVSSTACHQLSQAASCKMMRRHVTTVADKVADKRNIRDYKRRLLAAKYELRRNLYKTLWQDPNLPYDLRQKYRHKLSRLPRNSSFTRVRNRCIYSGRPRSVYKLFRSSRIVFRSLASEGALMGVKKASW
ncbi:Ribosomal protein S14 [Rhynchospora pubera]|uniref:Small ribosomal subunit protein uS14m n=1 Tax=Rhynchospora pubera TaxID=906938 RepID=A0AAV8F3X8_9POAL|nr:Ribosomal protein S14 [Rhynchospora pubera]